MTQFGKLKFEDITTRDLAKQALAEQGAEITATITSPTPSLIVRLDPVYQTDHRPYTPEEIDKITNYYNQTTEYYTS